MNIRRLSCAGASALFLALIATFGLGVGTSQAQTSDQVQVQTDSAESETVPSEAAEPVSPAAEYSGWADLGTWSIIVLVVVAALIAWLAFFRPRARPKQDRRD